MVGARVCCTVFFLVATGCGGATRTQNAGAGTSNGAGGAGNGGDTTSGTGMGGRGGAGLVDSGATSSGGAFHVDPLPTVIPTHPTDPKDCEDNDGLTYEEELAAGTDPCNADTNGDGCIDGAQVKLGGCDDPRNGVIVTVCMGKDPTTRVRFTAPDRDSGAWESLTLKENADDQAGLSLYIVATGGLLHPSGATYHDVPSGSTLEFDVSVLPSLAAGTAVVRLELYAPGANADADDAGPPRLVDQGKVLVVLRSCPMP